MVRRRKLNMDGSALLETLSVADLYAMFVFVSADKNRGFSAISTEQKAIVDRKYAEIEEELYRRTYGYNPFMKQQKLVVEGQNPETVIKGMTDETTMYVNTSKEPITQTFVVTKNEEQQEPKDEAPQIFVVAKNE